MRVVLRSLGIALSLLTAGVASAQGPASANAAPPPSDAPAANGKEAAGQAPAGEAGAFDVEKLFAGTCGWCHSAGGRVAGRGPKLMDSALTDEEMAYRIRKGKQAAMPAFESSFNDEQIKAIIQYARNLKPSGASAQ